MRLVYRSVGALTFMETVTIPLSRKQVIKAQNVEVLLGIVEDPWSFTYIE
jgi:hypothetical protein